MPEEEIDSSHARTFETRPLANPGGPVWGVWFEPNYVACLTCLTGLTGQDLTRTSRPRFTGRSGAEYCALAGSQIDIYIKSRSLHCTTWERAHVLQVPCNGRSYSHEPAAESLVPRPVRLCESQWFGRVSPHLQTLWRCLGTHGKGGLGMKLGSCAADHQIIL